jgi:endonuclease/exonuclease/phosphatase family metal-dependent hydrolase
VIKPKTRGFTVMTFNIYGARGLTLEAEYEALASVIRYVDPDFVLLQEVDSCTRRQAELPCNSAIRLTEILDTTTIYDWSYNYSPAEFNLYNQGGAYGDAILTKHKILWEKDYQMTYASEHNDDPQKEKRSVGVIKVSIDDKDVYVGCTHFDHLSTEYSRISQAHQLADIVAEYEGEIFVMGGDLNAKPDSQTMGIVTQYLTPSYTDPTQYTFPSQMNGTPSSMIDYVMAAKYSTAIRCTSSNVLNHSASDHCAVYATYTFVE